VDDFQQTLAELRITPGKRADLGARPTDSHLGIADRNAAAALLATFDPELDRLHNRLWAEASRSVLLVLQAMDAGGKDGTIRRVLTGLNPQGCHVVNFKEPGRLELAHDYLWRVHLALPERGLLGVMNRSHYEDVVTTFVLGTIDADRRTRRYRHIREWERMLVDEGTHLVKIFLHISKDEQRERLQARIDDPEKRWKFRRDDLTTRARWDDYQAAYEDAIAATSSDWAPWYVVPADRKWVRDVAVTRLVLDEFRRRDAWASATMGSR
jgi:PPK2 family polyphosphate:nucleotide phosphotransferase